MFEKELGKFRRSVERTFASFFGKEMSIAKSLEWDENFIKKYSVIYGDDYDKLKFENINPEHREDFAKHKTITYLLNVLFKLSELEKVIRGEDDES